MGILRNCVILTGHLGKDVEMHTFENGKQKASVSIAVKERWEQNGEWKEKSYWFNLVAWDKKAEWMGKHLKKGQKVNIQGSLTNRNYKDSNDVERTITEIVVNEFIPYAITPKA